MHRAVELALRSLQTADYSAIQDVLHDISNLHRQTSITLSELDTLVTEKLRSTTQNASTSYPKVAKWSSVRQAERLEKLQSQIRNTTNTLSTTMTALNTI
jgi:hypothetical protein